MTAEQIALAGAAGALLSIERKALAQLMLARPLVVAPLVGALLGQPWVGLSVGIPLELFFLGTASYGASAADHETFTALAAAALAAGAVGAGAPPSFALATAVMLALPLAPLGRRVDIGLERLNVGLVDRAEAALRGGRTGRASRSALGALLALGFLGGLVTVAGVLGGLALGEVAPALAGSAAVSGFALGWALFVGTCAALALRSIRTPGGAALSGVAALAVFAVAAASAWLLG